MSFIDKIVGDGIGGIVKSVTGLIDGVHTSDEERGEIKAKLETIAQKYQSELQETLRAELHAKENILVAELTQGDPYTKRARPTVVYAGLAFIFLNYCIVPIAQSFLQMEVKPLELPIAFWTAWGGIVATWSIGRSAERRGIKNKATNLITGSSLGSITSLLEK